MTPLGRRIARQIEIAGPMSLGQYMALALGDPRDGYYAGREAIGRSGDFVTAPEVSQMFGEMIGIWCIMAWDALGRPPRLVLAEAGPGRGTLMADLLRAARAVPRFVASLDLALIETSEAMVARQREALRASGVPVVWHRHIGELPPGPLLMVANEFLDALPIRQFVKTGPLWRERCVGLDRRGDLVHVLGTATIDHALLPPGAADQPDGAVFEVSPARTAWAAMLAERLTSSGGMALLIDYGYTERGFGDTFQAVRGHARADPLAEPGLADLTAHVDFSAVAEAAVAAGADASAVVTQGEFLLAMGLIERTGRLGATAGEAIRDRLRAEAERLAHADKMGSLFKVLALSSLPAGAPAPQFAPFLPAPLAS